MKALQWGVLSTAKIGQTQMIPAIQRSKNGEVAAIASSSERAAEIAESLSIKKIYDSYEDLLADPDIDAIYIPLPNHLHKKWVIEAAKHRKHILCEKPAALTADDTEEMVNVCHNQGVTFMEAFMYQFHSQHERVRKIIASGEIGEVKLIKGSFSFLLEDRSGNIRADAKKGGGSLFDVGCYPVHSIRHILGTEPLSIQAYGEVDPERGIDLSVFAHMKMANGVNAMFDCSFDMTNRNEYEVIGSKGVIRVPRAYRPDVVNEGEGLIIVEAGGDVRTETVIDDQYKNQVEHFAKAVLETQDPFYPGEQSIRNMKVIDACYESLRSGHRIMI
ncbi:Gfo/Idh/MocA family protein [Halalkalibacter hemicellulosilyticus]|uniref:Oxidoreductase n=1 Tax=Halalkalibacter hemicellulosilyticusJCM 9152 TaxID=1236971 RepID=W4QH61_9BACI|nr:Gfo/Idh/MocA family oxidoreductase [Halalkalibacter hemicellulosilyticus]GAE30978.1 oxidoreductase [Halalkalibacter hemicellulosilyticusJCM 9152]